MLVTSVCFSWNEVGRAGLLIISLGIHAETPSPKVTDASPLDRMADGSSRLFVGASKTDQEGRGAVLYLGAPLGSQQPATRTGIGKEHVPTVETEGPGAAKGEVFGVFGQSKKGRS